MKIKIDNLIRILLGIGLVLFGIDKFLEFIPHNHVMDDDLIAAYSGLIANKFILPTVGVVEFISGLLLLSRKYSFISLLLMVPVTYGIIAFHLSVDLEGIVPGLIVMAMHLYLLLLRKTSLLKLIN